MSALSISRNDVFVVGGGPAGLAAAIASRLQGFEVTVVDAAHPDIDKACGEGILPAGVEALRRLGVPLGSDDGLPFRGIRFIQGEASIEAPFRGEPGIAIRRTCLHRLLVGRATALGVRLVWNSPLRGAASLPDARWIVGADGQRSLIRREADLDAGRSSSTRAGFRRHYRLAPWTDMVEVYWGAGCQVYVTPVSPTEIGVALLARDSHLRLDAALQEFPSLHRRLRGASPATTERGALTICRSLQRVYRGHTALIGDASGSVDAITGDGLSLSFLQADALARSLVSGDLHEYQSEHRRLARNPAILAHGLLLLDRFPALRRLVFRGFAYEPSIFSLLLAHYAPGS